MGIFNSQGMSVVVHDGSCTAMSASDFRSMFIFAGNQRSSCSSATCTSVPLIVTITISLPDVLVTGSIRICALPLCNLQGYLTHALFVHSIASKRIL